MKLESQVASLELSKRLKELGVKQESYFYWTSRKPYEQPEEFYVSTYNTCLSAFTVAELGEMLPGRLRLDDYDAWLYCTKNKDDDFWDVRYRKFPGGHEKTHTLGNLTPTIFQDKTEADARAKMLIHLIEQKIVTPEKL